jgi:xanthine dehydrogenase accessory factor
MSDLGQILPLWHEIGRTGADCVLATVVAVEGSSYRKPGARMLLAQDGRRAGTVSGGCLESEVARRAWWLTASGPVIERYSTQDDEDERPYGSGCGGVVYLLLERRNTAEPLLVALDNAFKSRLSLAIATILNGREIGMRVVAGARTLSFGKADQSEGAKETAAANTTPWTPLEDQLRDLATRALQTGKSFEQTITLAGMPTRVLADYMPARPALWIFSAGDDAKPLVQLANALGWYVVIADGRSHLTTRERFPTADELLVLPVAELPEAAPQHLHLLSTDAAVVMTHSFEQDSRVLASLLALDFPVAYLGVLGPQRRTRELLAEAGRLLQVSCPADRIEHWLSRMNAPTGLDLGADTPATIALSILAEAQKSIAGATGQPLRQVRGERVVVACDRTH